MDVLVFMEIALLSVAHGAEHLTLQ